MPIERRKPSGKTASVATAAPTVTDEKAIVRPAVRSVVADRIRAAQLLPVARHQQQAVVDGEAEPGAGDDVERVGRDGRDRVEHAQEQERREDRQPAHDERQQGRDDAAEDEQRDQEERRKGERLGAREVALHLVVDLHDRDRRAADGRARHLRQPPVDALGRLAPALLRDAAARVGGDDGLAPVAREERGREGGEDRLGAHERRDPGEPSARRPLHQDEELRGRGEPRRVLDRVLGPDALCVARQEVVRGASEPRRHPEPEHGGDDREGGRDGQHAARVRGRKAREPVHSGGPYRLRRRLRVVKAA